MLLKKIRFFIPIIFESWNISLVSKKHVFRTPESILWVPLRKTVNDPPLELVLKYVSSYSFSRAPVRKAELEAMECTKTKIDNCAVCFRTLSVFYLVLKITKKMLNFDENTYKIVIFLSYFPSFLVIYWSESSK